MNLADNPFQLIKNGHKKVEMRLYSEERSHICPNDHIVFTNNISQEKLEVLVLKIDKYPTFKELYDSIDKKLLGYKEEEVASYEDMYLYYQKESILKNGVLAIYIELI